MVKTFYANVYFEVTKPKLEFFETATNANQILLK